MTLVRRACLDCGRLTTGSRCPDCRRAWDNQRRPAPADRGHGHEYRKAREAQLAAEPYCQLRLPGCTGIATTADYIVPVSRGGTLDDGLRSACAHCNTSRGNREV